MNPRLNSTLNKLRKQKRPTRGLISHILVSCSFILIAGLALKGLGRVGLFISIPLTSAFFFRSFALFHDAAHGIAHTNRSINFYTGLISSIGCFLPFWPWRQVHLDHHRWTGNIKKDPVLAIIKNYPHLGPNKKRLTRFAWRSWIPILAVQQHIVFWKAGLNYSSKKAKGIERYGNILSYAVLVGAYSLLLVSVSNSLFYINYGLALLFYLAMVEIVNFPHHLDLNTNQKDCPSPPSQQAPFCRSCHHSHWLSYLVLCNFNYHTEHHLYPHIPWYQLHKVAALLPEAASGQYNKSDGFNWIIKMRQKPVDEIMNLEISTEMPVNEPKKAA